MNVLKFFSALNTTSLVKPALAATLAVVSLATSAQSIVMSSTTSTEQSGLFSQLLPAFKAASGIDIKEIGRAHV